MLGMLLNHNYIFTNIIVNVLSMVMPFIVGEPDPNFGKEQGLSLTLRPSIVTLTMTIEGHFQQTVLMPLCTSAILPDISFHVYG